MSYSNTGSTHIPCLQNVVTGFHIVLQEVPRYIVPRYNIVLQAAVISE